MYRSARWVDVPYNWVWRVLLTYWNNSIKILFMIFERNFYTAFEGSYATRFLFNNVPKSSCCLIDFSSKRSIWQIFISSFDIFRKCILNFGYYTKIWKTFFTIVSVVSLICAKKYCLWAGQDWTARVLTGIWGNISWSDEWDS